MTNRFTILAILVLLALIAAYGISRQSVSDNSAGEEEMSSEQQANIGAGTLEDARNQVRQRVQKFEKMTPEQWDEELKIHPRRHGTLEEALKRSKDHLAQLEAMTPEDWKNFQAGQGNGNHRQSKMNTRTLPNLGPKLPLGAAAIQPGKGPN